jgi:hypothetical protein
MDWDCAAAGGVMFIEDMQTSFYEAQDVAGGYRYA